ncbi:MAG: hypothetical protein KF805_08000 [Phycisphaeraceae bacterium]|nr:hypothetical protein [Phycisphaeraceae bacterium]
MVKIASLIVSSALASAALAADIVAQSTFDSGLDGWTPVGRTCALTNGGGYLLVQDIDNDWSRPLAPASYNGDWDKVGRISLDVRPDNSKPIQWGIGLRVKNAGGQISEFEFPTSATPIGVWTRIGVQVGSAPGQWNIPAAIRSAVTEFTVRIDVNDRSLDGGTLEFSGLDNVILYSTCPGDLNNDGFVDDSDFVIFLASYNILDCADPSMPAGCPADFNRDGFVEDADFVIFVGAYNQLLCP